MKNFTTTLRELNPEAAEMWHYDLNGDLTPDTVSGKSDKEVYFRCLSNPKHIFKKKISEMTDSNGHSYGCIYCGPHAKKVISGKNNFFTRCPEAQNMWNYNLNCDIDPTYLSPYSEKYAYFICEKGHSTYRKIINFYHSPKCSECEKEKTKLVFQFPNTRLFWDSKKNLDVNLDDIIQSSRYNANFKCPNCNYEWKWSVELWNKIRYCPCCGFDGTNDSIERNHSIIAQNPIITFRMANPKDAEMWCYDLNGDMTPDNTLYASNKRAYFKCKRGHEFSSTIYKMTNSKGKPKGCPYCNKIKAYPGENDFFTVCPAAKNMWDYDKNIGIDPKSLSPNSAMRANFKCSLGHEFFKTIHQFTRNPVCPECEFIEKRSIALTKPEMLVFWDYEKNILSPYEVSPHSKKEAFWKCKKCGYSWKTQINSRAAKNKCPSCDLGLAFNQEQNNTNTYRQFNPEASKMWIDELNNGLTPDNVSKGSGKTVYLRCAINPEHIYPKKICDIPNEKPFGCPYCRGGRKIAYPGINDVFTVCPECKEMWDWEKNVGIDPYHLLPGSRTRIHLKCKRGHEFQRTVNTFIKSPKCSECEKTKINISNISYMVKQWDFIKNNDIDINLTSSNSKDIVWWKCKKCGYEWQAQIYTRKRSKGLCPCCDSRTIIKKGVTDLFTMVPYLKQDYDTQKNINVDAAKLSTTTADAVWWKCHICGYEWKCSPTGRLKYKQGKYIIRNCPVCAGIVRIRTYAEEYPELIERFIENKNNCKLSDLKKGKDTKLIFWWHCYICGEDFESTLGSMIRSRNSKNKGCSYCAGKKVKREKSFAYLHPEVMDEYDSSNSIDPYNVAEHSVKEAKWICRNNPEHRWKAKFQSRARGEGGCNFCRGWHYNKFFAEEHPEFEQYYDTEKNKLPFSNYSNSSNKTVWWKCDEGHSFEWPIQYFSRLGRFDCPICSNKVLVIGENDLESQYHDLAMEFDIEKNGITPDRVSCYFSRIDVWWKCAEGHEFQRSVWYRINQTRDCPICSRSIVVKGINDFQTTYPDIIKVWDYKKNVIYPDQISDRHNGKFSFKCNNGHHYETMLKTAIANNFECMVCNGKIILDGINSLLDTHPDLAKEFSPNEERMPSEFTKDNMYSIKWLCPTCGGEYLYPINEREVGDDSCPYCRNNRVLAGYNSLVDTNYDLAKEWSPTNERAPETYFKTNKSWVFWLCPTCGGEYQYPINRREVGDDSCPYCNRDRALVGYNSLVDTHPDLAKEFSPNEERMPSEFTKENVYPAKWLCQTCGGEYQYPINRREVGDDSCPYCNRDRALVGYNSLVDTHPDLAKEFSPNEERMPSEFTKENVYPAKWLCQTCGGEYQYPINRREVGDDSCPYCKGTKILPGYNSFKHNHPDLMEEWDFIDNYILCDADNILDNYLHDVWWICKDCNKKYLMTTKRKLYYQKRHMKSCPYCKGLRQKKRHFL